MAGVFGFFNKGRVEAEMAEWLASPMEYGAEPKSVRLKRTYKGTMPGYGKIKIHLMEYVMPDGTGGVGL